MRKFRRVLRHHAMKFVMGSLMCFVLAFLFNHKLLTPLFWLFAAVLFLLGLFGEIDSVFRKMRRYKKTVVQKKKKSHSTHTPHRHSDESKRSHGNHGHHSHERVMKTEDGEDIVSLPVSKTEELHFVKLADMTYEGKPYVIMQRARHLKNRGIDDAVLFRVETGENGETDYVIERNEKIVGTVFTEYRKNLGAESETEK